MQSDLKKRLEEERDRHVAGYPGPRRGVAELLDDALSALTHPAPTHEDGSGARQDAGAKLAKAVFGIDLVPATRTSGEVTEAALMSAARTMWPDIDTVGYDEQCEKLSQMRSALEAFDALEAALRGEAS